MEELKLDINIDDGQEVFTTDHIKAKLDSIIIDSTDKTEVIIESELGYPILVRSDHIGVQYYAVRSITTTPISDIIDSPTFVKFGLNEKLIITVRGRKHHRISITFRFDD